MYFDEDFVKSLPDDWPHAALMISEKLNNYLNADLSLEEKHSAVRELWALLTVLRPKHSYPVSGLPDQADSDISIIKQLVNRMAADAKECIQKQSRKAELSYYQNVYEISLGNVFHFEFSEGDLERIQKLANELRDLISKSEEFEEKHKQRLLRKLEKFQSELHKKVSSLDRTWGFLLEASIVLGQMGENVKPIVDRIRELVSVIGPTSTRAYDLPSNLPIKLLGQAEDDKNIDEKS